MPGSENPPLTVLVADDETEVLALIGEILESGGFSVVTARDGLEAYDLIAADPGRFDVLLTDNRMPALCGIELVERLSALPFKGRIVVFSGSLIHSEIESFLRLGAASILRKPASAQHIIQAVRGF